MTNQKESISGASHSDVESLQLGHEPDAFGGFRPHAADDYDIGLGALETVHGQHAGRGQAAILLSQMPLDALSLLSIEGDDSDSESRLIFLLLLNFLGNFCNKTSLSFVDHSVFGRLFAARLEVQ